MSPASDRRGWNLALWRSGHAAIALLLVAAVVVALAWLDAAPGRGPGSQRDFLLWTGWLALALFAVVLGYVARKYMHARGYSPEFWMRPVLGQASNARTARQKMAARLELAVQREEAAELRLNELRARIRVGAVREHDEIQEEAERILAEEGAQRLFRVEVVPQGETFVLETRPSEPLGRLARWLHAHLYYGLAALVVVGLHGGFPPRTPMAWLLVLGTALVVASGLWGIATWTRGPTWLTRKERELGLTIEMAHALDFSLGLSLQGALEKLDEADRKRVRTLSGRLGQRFEEEHEALLQALSQLPPEKREHARDALILAGQVRSVRVRLGKLRRVRWTFQGWRGLHVPIAWAFLGLILLHTVSVLWY